MFPNPSARQQGPMRGNRLRSAVNPPKVFRGRTRPNLPLSSKYKTEMCHYLAEQGRCPFSDQCTYAHSAAELRHIERHPKHKTLPCRDFSTVGFCPFGERCSFVHYKRDPDDILKGTYALSQQQQSTVSSSHSPAQFWRSSSVALTVSPSPDPEEISDSEHGHLARLPSPCNDMGMYCGSVLASSSGSAIARDFLQVPGSLSQPRPGSSSDLMCLSPHSLHSSGFSDASPSSPVGSPLCTSMGTLSRSSSSSDLSDIVNAPWPVQLCFPPEYCVTVNPKRVRDVAHDFDDVDSSRRPSRNEQRLPVFRDLSSKVDENYFNMGASTV